jgi:hypothetical protein
MKGLLFLAMALVLLCCGSSGSPTGVAAATTPSACCVLSIQDYMNWCSITENGVPYSASESFDAGVVVSLEAVALPGFAWGYWTGTDGASGGQDMNFSATVTMNASKSILACCPSATDDCNGDSGGMGMGMGM